MSDGSKIRVGLLQLESHPAVTVAGWDLLSEVNVPPTHDASLDTLARQGAPLRTFLERNRETYVNWSERRLQAVLEPILVNAPPDLLLLPECAAPFETLGEVRGWMTRVSTNVVAGTHAFRASTEEYRPLGVRKGIVEQLVSGKSRPPAVAPVFIGNVETHLWGKTVPSIFQQSESTPPADRVIQPRSFQLAPSGKRVALFVCAEAQVMVGWSAPLPDIVAIVAYEERPERYEPLLKQVQQNQIPGVLVNDGKFGGSAFYVASDRRSLSWWDEAPMHGRLPAGDYYVEFELDLAQQAVQVGVASPRAAKRLLRFLPVIPESEALTLDGELRRALGENASAKVEALLHDLGNVRDVPQGLVQRWRYLLHRMKAKDLDPAAIATVGESIAIPGLPTLRSLEAGQRTDALAALGELIEKPEQLNSMLVGQVVKARAALKSLSKTTAEELSANVEGNLSLAAGELARPILEDVLDDTVPASLVSGLPGSGKSSAIKAAVVQSGFRKVARIRCVPGTSADYLYESLLRKAGMMPRGTAPRSTFEVKELEAALQGFDITWIEDVDTCFAFSDWVSLELGAFFACLQAAADGGRGGHVLLESARQSQLWSPRRGKRRSIKGLSTVSARLFLEQQLRRLDLHGRVSDEAKRQILDACKGHPGFLMLVAGACASGDPEGIAKELKERGGFYNSLVDGLLRRIKLSSFTSKLLAGLAQCRSPVALSVFESVLPPVEISRAIAEASETALVEQEDGLVQINPLLARVHLPGSPLTIDEEKEFHRAAHRFFRSRPERDSGDRLLDMVEAAYHGMRGGVVWRPVFGHREGWTGVAREAYDKEDYATVIRILEPIKANLSTDGLRYLAEAYAWTDKFADFYDTLSGIPTSTLRTGSLLTAARAAFHSGKFGEVERILEEVEKAAPGHYKIYLERGRLAERHGRTQQAELLYREACQRSARDRWPYFYLARLLVEEGLAAEALEIIEAAKDSPEAMSRSVEYALLQQEMVALVMLEEWERVRTILDVLDRVTELRPEAIVAAAYVRALFDEGSVSRVAVFEAALRRLERHQANRNHTRAQINLYRGQLLQSVGNIADARRALEEAIALDPANLYMKRAYLRVLYGFLGQPELDTHEVPDVAAPALAMAKSLLEHDAADEFAREVQRFLYDRWKLQ